MQGYSVWTPPGGTLGRIVAEAARRAAALNGRAATLRAEADAAVQPGSLRRALGRTDVAVIAEIKRRSPSKGEIAAHLSAADQSAHYVAGGAAAISVLTEPEHFGGSVDDLRAAVATVRVPVLRKDFIVDPLQLVEARACGASAALLIARALEPTTLSALADTAHALGLEILVEVRDERELERALGCRADVIGVNNRDLETLQIDASVSDRLIGQIPPDVPAVYESGVTGRTDVERAARAGADAVLVGSSVSSSIDAETAVRALTGVVRSGRGPSSAR